MKILYVHERFGALAGAEANAYITAEQLGFRGHTIGILHGPGTGKNEEGWNKVFPHAFPIDSDARKSVYRAVKAFRPDVVYVHKMADLEVISALVETGRPLAGQAGRRRR